MSASLFVPMFANTYIVRSDKDYLLAHAGWRELHTEGVVDWPITTLPSNAYPYSITFTRNTVAGSTSDLQLALAVSEGQLRGIVKGGCYLVADAEGIAAAYDVWSRANTPEAGSWIGYIYPIRISNQIRYPAEIYFKRTDMSTAAYDVLYVKPRD